MLHRRTFIMSFIALLALVLAACGGSQEPEPQATSAPATATTVPATETPAPTNTPAPTATSAPAETPEEQAQETEGDTEAEGEGASAELTDSAFALPGVDSYRSRMTISVSGPAFEAEEGQASEGLSAESFLQGFEILGEHTREPAAHHVTVKLGGETFAETIQIGDQTWVKSAMFGGDSWIQSDSGDDAVSGFTPDIFTTQELEEISQNWEEVGTEEINGVQVTHYRADKEALQGLMDLESEADIAEFNQADEVQLDLYVSDEGVLVKWEMHIEGTGLSGGNSDEQGAVDFVVELYDFNADDISIEEPETASAEDTLGFDVPIPEGASQTFSMQGMTSFEVSDTTIDDLVAFYTERMGELNFTYDESNSMTSAEFASLTFTGENTNVAINITTGEGEGAPLQVIIQTDQLDAGNDSN